jgi:hypothetical protein
VLSDATTRTLASFQKIRIGARWSFSILLDGGTMANGNQVGELLRNKGNAMETVEDPEATAASERPTGNAREDRIREAAYAASERRGFEPGHETDDWLSAEREIDSSAQAGTKAKTEKAGRNADAQLQPPESQSDG